MQNIIITTFWCGSKRGRFRNPGR